MNGIDGLEIIGGAYGAGERMRVQVEDLLALSQTCHTCSAETRAALQRLRQLAEVAHREIREFFLLASPVAMTHSTIALTGIRTPWLVGVSDTSDELTEFAAVLARAAGSYERVERDNTVWEPAGDGVIPSVLMGLQASETALELNFIDRDSTLGQMVGSYSSDKWDTRPKWLGVNLPGTRNIISSDVLDPKVARIVGHGDPTPNAVNPIAPAAAWLAAMYPDRPTDISAVIEATPRVAPSSLAQLYESLSWKEPQDGEDAPPGRVVVQHLRGTGPDGADRYVVSLPGTSDWELPGMDVKNDIRDLQGIGRGLSDGRPPVVAALPAALAKAGVPAGATIALVGHSLGGINAARAAADPTMRSRYKIAHVISAGAPVQAIRLPVQTRLLAMVNRSDVVPTGAGAVDRDTATSTTVRFSTTGELREGGGSHSMSTYTAAAAAVDERVAQIRANGPVNGDDRRYLDVDARLRADGF